MKWKVPQFVSPIGDEEAVAVSECVRSGWITEGARSEEFIAKVSEIAGVQYGVLAPNGTLALYLALKACGVGAGDKVLVPDLTFIATATAVIMVGAEPVFTDVDEYGQMPLGAAADWEGYTLPVHLYGMASAAATVQQDRCIEDACQGLGVKLFNKPCGSLGRASAFSFFADKTITTGEGGFVGTNDESVYEHLRYLRNQGRIDRGSFVHPAIGQNFRMTDVQAAIGLVQLSKMDEIVRRKRDAFASYAEQLEGIVELLQPPPGSSHIPFRAVALFPGDASNVAKFLKERGIEPRSAFYPLHLQPCFQSLRPVQPDDSWRFRNSIHFWDHALCLPTFPGIKQEQIDWVCDSIKESVREGGSK